MLMPRCAAAGGDDKAPHGEIGASVAGAAEKLHPHLVRARHGDVLCGHTREVLLNHARIRAREGLKEKTHKMGVPPAAE